MKSIFDDPEPAPEIGGPDWRKPSRAVVASDGDNGWIMFMVGPHIVQQCEDLGSRELDQIGLTCAAGIYVWEGEFVGGRQTGYFEYDDVELSGAFRAPTDVEWACIRAGICPWDPDDWVIGENATP